MMKPRRILTALIAGATVFSLTGVAHGAESDRLAGASRYDTAIAASQAYGKSSLAYLARGDQQADAVVGGKLHGGPLLLINGDPRVQAKVAAELKRLGAERVAVLGGKEAVPYAWVDAVAKNLPKYRLAGKDRYETAVEISKTLVSSGPIEKVYIANGRNIVDALVGGAMADSYPILLADGSGTLPKSTVEEVKRLSPKKIVALGGAVAVKDTEITAAEVASVGGVTTADKAEEMLRDEYLQKSEKLCMEKYGWLTASDGNTVLTFLGSAEHNTANLPYSTETEKTQAKKRLQSTWPRVCNHYITTTSNAMWLNPRTQGKSPDTPVASVADTDKAAITQYEGNPVRAYAGLEYLKTALPDGSTYDKSAFNGIVDAAIVAGVAKDTDVSTIGNRLMADLGAAVYHLPSGLTPTDTKLGTVLSLLGVSWTDFPVNSTTATLLGIEIKKAYKNIGSEKVRKYHDGASARVSGIDAEQTELANKITNGPSTADVVEKMTEVNLTSHERVAGADRYSTAVAIAKKTYTAGSGAVCIYLANGTALADASVGGYLDNRPTLQGPILLVRKDSIPAEVLSYLAEVKSNRGAGKVTVKALGGPAVVSDAVIKQAQDALN